MDEAYGRDVAAVEGIETRGAAYLLLTPVRNGEITADVARETLDGMLDAGWYCSPDLYANLVGKLQKLQGEKLDPPPLPPAMGGIGDGAFRRLESRLARWASRG